LSFLSTAIIILGEVRQEMDSKYLEECLKEIILAVRNSKLERIAQILNEQPSVRD
jgi:hypothetical protein